MTYVDRHKENVNGKYMFTLDWHHPDNNIVDSNYSINSANHKCGHVIEREDGNFAIQPNNRIHLWDPSHTTKRGVHLIDREVSDYIWGVEDGSKWLTSDDNSFNYEIKNIENNDSGHKHLHPRQV